MQYSYDDGTVWVVNNRYQEYARLRVTATVYNLEMTEKGAQTATVDVASNGKAKAFAMAWPEGLGRTYFLDLTLDDAAGNRMSENFYWLSTSPEVVKVLGMPFTRYAPGADFTGLQELPPVKLDMDYVVETQGSERVARVSLRNPTEHLAFFIHLAVRQGAGGPEVAPTYWEDNYFSLLPGQQKTVEGTFAATDLGDEQPVVMLAGWNLAP